MFNIINNNGVIVYFIRRYNLDFSLKTSYHKNSHGGNGWNCLKKDKLKNPRTFFELEFLILSI